MSKRNRQQAYEDAVEYDLRLANLCDEVFGPVVGRCLSETYLASCDEREVFVPWAVSA